MLAQIIIIFFVAVTVRHGYIINVEFIKPGMPKLAV